MKYFLQQNVTEIQSKKHRLNFTQGQLWSYWA